MAEGIGFDFSGLNSLAADLGEVPRETIANTRKAVEVTSRFIRDDWRAEAKRSNRKHARGYPTSITYDLDLDTDGQIGSEIGPELGRNQGQFGFLEEAPDGVRAAPQGNARKALRKNLRDFEQGILKAAKGVTDG